MAYPEPGGSGADPRHGDLITLGISDLKEIGRGATSTVYAARQERYARDVAVKVFFTPLLDDKARRRFERECRTLGRLSTHPNVVNFFGSGFDTAGRPFIVMDLCNGGSLQQVIAASGPMAVEDVMRIGVKACSALAYAHANNVLHRDIKPGNILLTEFGEPVLSDFGISDEAQQDMSWTIGASLTPLYAAPEVLESGGGSLASDIWSLAATLYALLLGDAPFADTSASLVTLINRIVSEEPRPLDRPDVPPALAAVLKAGMEKEAAKRPADAGAFAKNIQEVQRMLNLPVTEYTEVRATAPLTAIEDLEQQQTTSNAGATRISPLVVPETPPNEFDLTVQQPLRAPDVADDTTRVRSALPNPAAPDVAAPPPTPPVPPPVPPPVSPSSILPAPSSGPPGRPKWMYAAAAGVVVVGATVGIVLGTHHSSHPSSPTQLVALSAPAVKVQCHGFTCNVTGAPPASGGRVVVDFGDGTPVSPFTGSPLSHTYKKAGKYQLRATTVNGFRSSNATSAAVVLQSWNRSAHLTAVGGTSHRLTLKVQSPSSRCLPSTFQLQAHRTHGWSTLKAHGTTSAKGIAHLHVPGPGHYRVHVAPASVTGGRCAAAGDAATTHAPARHTSTSTTTTYVPPTTTTQQPPTTTTRHTTAPKVPVQPTKEPPPKS
ncbi:MAG TPA: protein kinase [Mycobacteriales bacterium]|nr:protein kinase [Mycobacteriales bacterium]